MSLRKITSAGVAALALAVPVAPALADHEAERRGAQVLRENFCLDVGPGAQVCLDIRSVFNVSETPSGNVNVVENSKVTGTLTAPGVMETPISRSQCKLLLKNGEPQVVSIRDRFTFTEGNMVCSGKVRIQVVQGDVKQERFDFNCVSV